MADPVPYQIVEQQSGFAPVVAPYAERLLGRAESMLEDPYMQYQGERFAGFTPLQQQAFAGAQAMQAAPQLRDASALAGQAGLRALAYNQYQPSQFANFYQPVRSYRPTAFTAPGVAARDLQTYQMGPAERVAASDLTAPQMATARTGYRPDIQAYQMGPAERVSATGVSTPQMQAAQTGYAPDLQTYQMGPLERIRTQSFARPGAAQQFMSPYMQNVVDIEKREAQRQADIAATRRGQAFARAGAFGGSRQAIESAEAQRNLATQMGDIQSRGLQNAYQQAQQQFNVEQQARLAAQQGNVQSQLAQQQANLQAALGVQQLGTQTGLQTALANLSSQQQANVQNQAAQLQAQGLNSEQALRAALANQQAGLTVGQQNLAAQQQAQQLGVQTGLQTALANLSAEQQANVQNQAAQLQTQGMGAQQALQAALANQQAGMTVGQQNLAAQLGVQQLGSQQGLQALLANQQAQMQAQQLAEQSRQYGYGQLMQQAGLGAQYGQAAAQLGEQSRQYGAGLGLQGLQTGLQAAGQLGQLGQQEFGQNLALNQLQAQYGGQQQQQAQNILGAQYQDYLNFQNYPYKQLGFMSDILRGVPLTQTGSTVYQQPPSTMSQIAGLGTAAIGASKLFGMKKGGAVEDAAYRDKPAGLADLAIYNMSV